MEDETCGSHVWLPSRKRVRVGWIIGGAVKPLEFCSLRENTEVEPLAETTGWRVPRCLQHSREHLIRYRLLFELPNHSSPAD
jgi:hypothetical protein